MCMIDEKKNITSLCVVEARNDARAFSFGVCVVVDIDLDSDGRPFD